MANSWSIEGPGVGWQPITENSTTQRHPIGTIVRAFSSTYGYGEFIYLKGIGSTVVGSVVTYNTATWVTTLSAVGGSIPRPIAVAMAATVADEYGWYQISGIAVMAKT